MDNLTEPEKDFQDWEVLPSDSDPPREFLHGIHRGGFIQQDYFCVDAQNRSRVGDLGGGQSVDTENPDSSDPVSEDSSIRFVNGESGEFLSYSSCDQSDDREITVLVENNESGLTESEKEQALREIGKLSDEDIENTVNISKLSSDSSGTDVGSPPSDEPTKETSFFTELDALGEERLLDESPENPDDTVHENGNKRSVEIDKKSMVWWKMPMEFLKIYASRLSPLWTVSAAAALMGFVTLSRRLLRTRRKSNRFKINISFDDKASHAGSRAARLNEAFSVVKGVPVIRPAVGLTVWPAMSLR